LPCQFNYIGNVIFSDETQVVVGHDRRVHVWRKADEIWRPECVGLRGGPHVAVMFWGCITFDGVGTASLPLHQFTRFFRFF
jgi:hypothetical protein